jgi:hypothetical protein
MTITPNCINELKNRENKDKILHTEVAPGFRKEPTNDFHRALDDA